MDTLKNMTSHPNIELIVIDVDDTLLNSKHELTEPTAKAIKEAIALGVKVMLATGKTWASSRQYVHQLGITTPSIFVQGLVIHNPDGTVAEQQVLEPDLIRRIVTYVEDRGFDVVAYTHNRLLTREASPRVNWLGEKYNEPMPESVGPLYNIVGEIPINKLFIIAKDEPKRAASLRWQLKHMLDGEARLMEIMLKDCIEILPPNTSKGTTLKSHIEKLGVQPENVMAIGDSTNDIEMLQLAGIGVAVGNANEKLKAVADYVVASSDEHGVAEAIERFVLKKSAPVESGVVESAPIEETPDAPTEQTPAPTEDQTEG